MALPVPNLDDRRFEELLREARQRIARLCPAWTDFNPSDPGMTLVELMAWLTDLTLYRVNRIPERSYAVFLNLMGVRLRPPEAARTWLIFEPRAAVATPPEAEGGPAVILVEAGTAAQARREGGPPLVFSTLEPLNLTPVRPRAVAFTEGEALPPPVIAGEERSYLLRTMPEGRPMRLVAQGGRAEHLLLLGHGTVAEKAKAPILAAAPMGGLLHLDIALRAETGLGAEVEWERAAGGSPEGERDPLHGGWRPWTPERDETLGLRRSGRITFRVTEPIFLRRHEGEALWLRGRLLRAQPDGLPELTAIAFRFELPPGAAHPPDRVCQRSAQQIFTELPIPRPAPHGAGDAIEVQPFGAEPTPEAAFLVGSPLLDRPGAEISVSFTLRNEGAVAEAAPPELRWEMFGEDGRWILLGRSTPEGARQEGAGGSPQARFTDGTNALTRSGTAIFRRPEGVGRFAVLGEAGPFLRVRLAAGRPHRVSISDIRIAFADPPTPFGLVVAERYGRLERLDRRLAALGKDEAVLPFEVHREEDAGPTLLIGLGGRPANLLQRLFLDLRPPREVPPAAAAGEGLRLFFTEGHGGAAAAPRTAWAYSGEGGWKPLTLAADGTRDLAMRGTIAFVAPPDWTATRLGEVEAHWLRARLDPALRPADRPRLAAVATNSVEAVQAEVMRDVGLAAPLTDEPWQRVELTVRPVLPGLVLAIRELDEPSEDALAELRQQPGVVLEDERPGAAAARAAWVRWQEVPDFFRSGPDSRHYTFDPVEGTVGFGDGRHGRIPPPGANRIRLVRFQRGGGAAGNLAARTIDQLLRPVEGVDRVYNPVPAEGGTDAEPVEEALRRGPYALRHRERAVTEEDYVRLACAASRSVARASCSVVDGRVQVLVIPDDGTETPYPGRYLVERVQSYLEARRVVGTRLRVTGPDYVEIAVSMSVALQPAYVARMQEVRRRIAEALRAFVHPVHGGPDLFARARGGGGARGRQEDEGGGGGWPLGRSLHVSELYYVVEQVEGVDYAEGIRIALAGEGGKRDKIPLLPTALPHFLGIEIGQVR